MLTLEVLQNDGNNATIRVPDQVLRILIGCGASDHIPPAQYNVSHFVREAEKNWSLAQKFRQLGGLIKEVM